MGLAEDIRLRSGYNEQHQAIIDSFGLSDTNKVVKVGGESTLGDKSGHLKVVIAQNFRNNLLMRGTPFTLYSDLNCSKPGSTYQQIMLTTIAKDKYFIPCDFGVSVDKDALVTAQFYPNIYAATGYAFTKHVKARTPLFINMDGLCMMFSQYDSANYASIRLTVSPIDDGLSATTSADYTQPANGSTVTITPTAMTMFTQIGNYIYITGGGYYKITAIGASTITVQNLNFQGTNGGVTTNPAAGTVIASGAAIINAAHFTYDINGVEVFGDV